MLNCSLISAAVFVSVLLMPGDGQGEDYASIHFRCDVSDYDAAYLENRAAVASLEQILRETGVGRIESIDVVAYASPEGGLEHNIELSQARAAALAPLIKEYLPTYSSLITVEAGGEAWEPLRRRIMEDTNISEESRNRILRILDDDSVGLNTKKWRLQNRLGQDPEVGNLYRYLLNKHYRYLRCIYIIIRYKETEETEEIEQKEPVVPIVPEVIGEQLPPVQPQITEPEPQPKQEPVEETILRPILAVSTNLLYDLAITPNVAVEVPIGQHWSVLADYTFPWWVNRTNDMAWQLLKWELGGRYWLGKRNADDPMDVLRGHFLGLDLGLGYYDLEPRHTGWQGEFVTAGVEYGYGCRLGKKWRLDFYGGVGIFLTGYRYYEGNADDSKLIWQYDGRYTWFGPVKLGASIQYIFTTKKPGRHSK